MTGPYDREATMAGLTRALPYIRLYKGRVFVIKLGGALGSDGAALRQMAEQINVLREVGIRVVLVHGGGPQTTDLAGRLGIETRFVNGRRVTTPAALEAAVMTLNGSVNTAVLAACRAAHLPAIGVSGVDAALLRARLRPPVEVEGEEGPVEVDFGEVGDLVSVDRTVLDKLLAAGFVPVVSPISADDGGRVLNVNADTAAATIACALDSEKLIFLTDTPGILEDRADLASMISCTDLSGLAAMEQRGALVGGMLPKVNAARLALGGGVRRVHIVGYRQAQSLLIEVFTNEGAGTLIVTDIGELPPAEHGADGRVAAGGVAP
ncbi:MAG: acetylglutamate kinase [Thermoanaerobaculaceae bacterium]|jgi:acetylglutamate kinase